MTEGIHESHTYYLQSPFVSQNNLLFDPSEAIAEGYRPQNWLSLQSMLPDGKSSAAFLRSQDRLRILPVINPRSSLLDSHYLHQLFTIISKNKPGCTSNTFLGNFLSYIPKFITFKFCFLRIYRIQFCKVFCHSIILERYLFLQF